MRHTYHGSCIHKVYSKVQDGGDLRVHEKSLSKGGSGGITYCVPERFIFFFFLIIISYTYDTYSKLTFTTKQIVWYNRSSITIK